MRQREKAKLSAAQPVQSRTMLVRTGPGYCELCQLSYDNQKEHMDGTLHFMNSVDSKKFVGLDDVIIRVEERKRVRINECLY